MKTLLFWLLTAAAFAQVPSLNYPPSPAFGTSDGGTTITMTGTNLSGTSYVVFGSVFGTVLGSTATQVTVISPAQSPATISIYVRVGPNYSNLVSYVYTADTPTMTVTNTCTSTATSTNTATQTATNTPTQTFTNTSTNTSTNTATNTETNTATQTSTNTATNTATQTATNTMTSTATQTPTNSATNTATQTTTNTATITSTNTPTMTATSTITALPNINLVLSLPQSSTTPTPVTSPVPGNIDDLYVTGINNYGTSPGDVFIWLGNTLKWQMKLLNMNTPVGGFILRGDGVNSWSISNPSQAGATINFDAGILLRPIPTPVPVY